MNIPLKGCGFNREAQAVVEELDEAVQAMIGSLAATMNQRVGAIDPLNLWVVLDQPRDARVVLPQLGANGTDVRHESAGITPV